MRGSNSSSEELLGNAEKSYCQDQKKWLNRIPVPHFSWKILNSQERLKPGLGTSGSSEKHSEPSINVSLWLLIRGVSGWRPKTNWPDEPTWQKWMGVKLLWWCDLKPPWLKGVPTRVISHWPLPKPESICTVNLRWLLVLLLLPHFFLRISREYLEVPWTFLEIVSLYGNIPGSCSGYLWLMPFLLSQRLPSNQHDNHLPLRLRPKQIWLSGYLKSVDSTLGVGWTCISGHCAKFGS